MVYFTSRLNYSSAYVGKESLKVALFCSFKMYLQKYLANTHTFIQYYIGLHISLCRRLAAKPRLHLSSHSRPNRGKLHKTSHNRRR